MQRAKVIHPIGAVPNTGSTYKQLLNRAPFSR